MFPGIGLSLSRGMMSRCERVRLRALLLCPTLRTRSFADPCSLEIESKAALIREESSRCVTGGEPLVGEWGQGDKVGRFPRDESGERGA